MKGTLIRRAEGDYKLFVNDTPFGQSKESPYKKLSIKNCEAIENGYDLDELASEDTQDDYDIFDYNDGYGNRFCFNNSHKVMDVYIKGFQKAMELMEGKKFTYNDVQRAFIQGVYTKNQIHGKKEEYMESLQPTEWEVEIEMGTLCRQIDCVDNATLVKSKIVWDKEDPILDKDGCLILKRI